MTSLFEIKWVWGLGGLFWFSSIAFEVCGLFVVLFLSFCRLVYLTGNFPIENKWKCIPAPLFFSSSGIQTKNPTGESPGCCPQEEGQEAEPRCAHVASKPPLTLNRESRWKEAGRAVLGSQPLNSLKESKQARQAAKGKGQNSLSTKPAGRALERKRVQDGEIKQAVVSERASVPARVWSALSQSWLPTILCEQWSSQESASVGESWCLASIGRNQLLLQNSWVWGRHLGGSTSGLMKYSKRMFCLPVKPQRVLWTPNK